MTGISLGLDVAWDVFGAAGTVLLAWSLWSHRRFHPLLALSGIVAGLALLALNIATFPTPPAEAGWVDLGPLVALWYIVACVWLVVVACRHGAGPEVRQSQDIPAGVGAA